MERRRCKRKPLIQLKKTLEKQEEIIAEYQRCVEDTYFDGVVLDCLSDETREIRNASECRLSRFGCIKSFSLTKKNHCTLLYVRQNTHLQTHQRRMG